MDETLKSIAGQAEHFIQQGEYSKALDLYDLCLQKDPDNVHFRYCVATMYSEMGKYGIAVSMLKQCVKDAPTHPQAWNNLGIAYRNAGQTEKAIESYSKALDLNYDPLTLVNMSGAYINNGTPQEALKWAQKGLKLDPGLAQLNNHRALAMLEMGNFKEGFQAYESRFGLPGWHARKYQGPQWTGERVDTLLVHGEQGLGDEIMFLGALERVQKRVGKVVLECATRLTTLLSNSFGVECYGTEEEIHKAGVKYDAWVPMGSLFSIVGFERKGPYLKPTGTYPKGERFRIGLSFRGGTIQTHQHLRNLPLEMWKPLAELDADVISLQYGPAAGMAAKLGLPHDQGTIDDIDKLAAMIKSCDLVISVCNTTVHMAGALGVPCWCLTPNKPAWRYGFTSEMPFYQSVKLIQQGQDDWPTVINRVVIDLADYAGVYRAEPTATRDAA